MFFFNYLCIWYLLDKDVTLCFFLISNLSWNRWGKKLRSFIFVHMFSTIHMFGAYKYAISFGFQNPLQIKSKATLLWLLVYTKKILKRRNQKLRTWRSSLFMFAFAQFFVPFFWFQDLQFLKKLVGDIWVSYFVYLYMATSLISFYLVNHFIPLQFHSWSFSKSRVYTHEYSQHFFLKIINHIKLYFLILS